ncbi:hypothetical protein [Streptomyces sp. 8L]|uniref:hypothetical protein n=1 Tax=Streptomyces sp. 8L TaxID=2877242 RepID=UPI001CD66F6E|nr:hypothetical protein [Streptomyces sp. 8L]MCA1218703.1 hypothetical protein [Streptomyces sp. 8L]
MGRVAMPGDPVWTEEDTLLALEYTDWAGQICPGCGHHLSESTHPDNEDAYATRDQVCFACEAKEKHVQALQDPDRNAVTAGRKIGVVRRGDDN